MRVQEVFEFIHERWLVQQRRASGAPKPWTANKILQQYRFTCAYREDDKVTRWITENWRAPHADDPDAWFALTVARFFNLPQTLQIIKYPVPFKPERLRSALSKMEEEGLKLFSAAYMVRSDPGRKLDYVLDAALGPLWKDRAAIRPRKGDKLAQFYARLRPYYGLGGFMCGQIIADTKYLQPLKKADDWWTWAVSGPGSRRGLNRIMGRPVEAPWQEEEWLAQAQLLQLRLNPLLRAAGMPRMHLQDVQGIGMCEMDKMERARLGEGRPKQLYPGT